MFSVFRFLISLLLAAQFCARANPTIFHLKNGDRISGDIVSEGTNAVVIATPWSRQISIPETEIERRETVVEHSAPIAPPPSAVAIEAAAPSKKQSAKHVALATPPPVKKWKAEARVGADFLYGAKNQQLYNGRLKWAYTVPYRPNSKKLFRNTFDYSAAYGWTESPGNESVISANRMLGSNKADFDVGGGKWFTYGLGSAGYDEVRKIDLQYEAGAGMGFHLLTQPWLTWNLESGMDYQAQYRSDQTTVNDLYFRLAQDAVWNICPDIKLVQKVEFTPRADFGVFQSRAESTLSYALWRNLSLNLSVLDLYDTRPAKKVTNNDLQVHTSLGFSF